VTAGITTLASNENGAEAGPLWPALSLATAVKLWMPGVSGVE